MQAAAGPERNTIQGFAACEAEVFERLNRAPLARAALLAAGILAVIASVGLHPEPFGSDRVVGPPRSRERPHRRGRTRLSRVPDARGGARLPGCRSSGGGSPSLIPRSLRQRPRRRPARRPRSLRPLSSLALVAPGGRAARPRVPTNRKRGRRPLATPNISTFRRGRARVRARRARAGTPRAGADSVADARARNDSRADSRSPSRRPLRNRRRLRPPSIPRSSIRRSP